MNSAINIINRIPHWTTSENAAVLTKTYDEAINIVLWQRAFSGDVCLYVDAITASQQIVLDKARCFACKT